MTTTNKNESKNGGVKIVNGGDKKPDTTKTPKSVITLLTPVELAKQFNTDSKKIRVLLRKHKIQKNDDGKYGWNQKRYDEIAKIIKSEMVSEKPVPTVAK